MTNFSAIFSEFKRLLAISSTSRQDPDITLPIISPSLLEPTSNLRDPNTSPNGIPLPPPPPSSTHADGPLPLYLGFHITSHHALGHSSSVTHPPLASPTRAHAPTNRSPPSPPLQIQDYSPSGSDISIGVNIPPPAYFSGDQPPTYSRHGNSIGPTWHMAGAQSGGFFDLASHPRSRISPVVGSARRHLDLSDPSQNRYPGSYLPGRATSYRGMHRGTLFARIIPARRNLWLPAIVVSAVIGVYVLVKVGGKDEDMKK